MRRWLLILVALAVVPGYAQSGQDRAPTLKAAARLVQVQVVVSDKHGPVAGLTKDDFAVFDEGTSRAIGTFSFQSAAAAQPGSPSLPPGTFSNVPQYGAAVPASVTVVLLDNLNTLYGTSPESLYETRPSWMEDLALQNAKVHLIEFIRKLDPRDRVAIYGLTDSLHVLCDFTSDRDQLLAVLNKYDTTSRTNRGVVEPGAFHTPVPGPEFNASLDRQALQLAAMNNEVRSADTMAALRAIAAHVADVPGRKNLVWLTANLPFSGAQVARILAPAQIAAYPVDGRALLTRTPVENAEGIQDEDAAARGVSMPAQSSQPIGLDAMRQMAEQTGGRAFINTNDLTGAIHKAVDDSAAVYTLGFYIPTDALDGKFHRVKVTVKRPGVEVRYPSGYFATKDAPAGEDENRNVLSTAIRTPLESSAINLYVRAEKAEVKSFQLTGVVGIRNVRMTEENNLHRGAVDVYVVQQDAAGKVLATVHHRLNMQLTDAQYQQDLNSGILFRELVEPRPELATVRVIVEDPATALTGSLIIPLSQIQPVAPVASR